MAELIEMSFGLRTWVGPGNHVLNGSPDPPWEGAILRRKARPIVKYRDTLQLCLPKRLKWIVDLDGPKESCVRWGFRSSIGWGNFGERQNIMSIVKYRDFLP